MVENLEVQPLKSRKNAFSLPFNRAQIFTFTTMVVQVLITCFVTLPAIENKSIQITCAICTTVTICLTVTFCLLTSCTNPEFKAVKVVPSEESEPDPEANAKIDCPICHQKVPDSSKHCGNCNKWVPGFDHHWQWLNTWIGQKNYKFFILFVIFYSLFGILVIIQGMSVIVGQNEESTMLYGDQGQTVRYLVAIICALLVILSLPVLIFWIGLLWFHIYLRINNLTTYEFITIRRKTRLVKVNFFRNI